MRFPAWFNDSSIRQKFIFIAFLATGSAMVFAILLSTFIHWFMLREDLVESVSVQASIIAANSTEAIVSNDHAKAEKIVKAFANIDNIEFAGILDKQGKDFALYLRPGLTMPIHHHHAEKKKRHIHTARYIEIVIPVVLNQEYIGMIHVRASMAPVYVQLGWNILVTLSAAAGAFLAAVMMIFRLLPAITNPLHSLIGVMKRVSRDNDFTLRSTLHSNDEIGTLADGFNTMLAQIQSRDGELERYREHLQEEITLRTDRLTEAHSIAHLGNWEWDIRNNTLSWSDEIYRIFGFTPQQFDATYESFMQSVHPEDRQSIETAIREALEGHPYNINHRILLPDGTVRHVHEHGKITRNEEGQPIKMLGTVQDITEEKAAEEKLKDANEQLSLLLNSLPIAVYRCLAEGDFAVMYISSNVVAFTGYEPKDFMEKTDLWFTHIHPDDAPKVGAEIALLFEQGTHTYEYRWLNADGTYVWIQDSIKLIRPEDGTPIYMVGMWQDITVHKQTEENIRQLNENLDAKVKERTLQLLEAQEELVRKEKMAILGQVAVSMGQELRNPLGVMNNAVYFLQSVLPDADEKVKDYLKIIKNEIAGSERIISDLLDSAHTNPPYTETAGVRELIEQILGKLTIPSTVTVKLEIPETLPPLWVDAQQIHQVLRNLISNGIEAMPEGGTLDIRALSDEVTKKITLSVHDSGIGITPEHLDKLFQPLFTTKARGIGLGLVVVKNMTEANGGTIKVESEVGKGTVFTLTLPSAEILP
ncbi:PAS domain-containing protein [Sulfuricurvum sp.]|uniref:PAS domain-containing protein n=1 Tax=Sulfuricurvum sp. TaxID=2025608 RepID=UPI003C500C3E